MLGAGERACTCGGRGTDGFDPIAGSESREVDNKTIIRAEPWDVSSSFSTRDVIFHRFQEPIGINNFNGKGLEGPIGSCPGEIEALRSDVGNI